MRSPCHAARVVTQLTYDAYGQVLGRDDPAGPIAAELHAGHKGLFFDRLDLGIVDPSTGAETPRLAVNAMILGENRNRTLNPAWGRFLQRDPNATGLVVQAASSFSGQGLHANVQSLDLRGHFTDGASLLAYLGSHPLTASDPQGLEFTLSGTMANLGGRAMIGGAMGLFLTMLMHNSGNDRLTYRAVGVNMLVGAGFEVALGGASIAFSSFARNRAAAGEIGAGGRMLADDVALQEGLTARGWPSAADVRSVADIPSEFRNWPSSTARSGKGAIYRDPNRMNRTVRLMKKIEHPDADPIKHVPAGYTVYSDGYGGSVHLPGQP